MTNRGPVSNEAIVAVLEERFSTFMRQVNERFDTVVIHQSELNANMKALESRERERNGLIRKHDDLMAANNLKWDQHLAWSEAKAKELDSLQSQHRDSNVRSQVWQQQAKLVLGGSGISGLVFGVMQYLGVF